MDKITDWINQYPQLLQIVYISGVILLSIFAFIITKKFLIKGIAKLVSRTRSEWDDLLFDTTVTHRLAYISPILILYNFAYLFADFTSLVERISIAVLSLVALLITGSILTAVNDLYDKRSYAKTRPIKSYIQIIKLIIYVSGSIIIIAVLIGQSPWYLLTGLGALTAVILLIFRDTILSFVASLQISSNDLVRVGDWIEVPVFGADGDVIDLALHTIKIQNWDKTITVIPTHKLIDVSFKNWRGMQQTGGRRIKRSLFIDQNSIRFCDNRLIKQFEQIHLIRDYVIRKQDELRQFNEKHGYGDRQTINSRRLTNIGTFRVYIEKYLLNHPNIHKELTIMVRQLAPQSYGLPLEIYAFANDIAWTRYESIQADIFDHILAIVPEFELEVFQNPSGRDFQRLTQKG